MHYQVSKHWEPHEAGVSLRDSGDDDYYLELLACARSRDDPLSECETYLSAAASHSGCGISGDLPIRFSTGRPVLVLEMLTY